MEENNKRKTVALTVIGVAVLLVLVIGSTFAYFSITNNSSGSSQARLTGDIEDLDKYGEAFLTGGKNLHINLAASDMSYSKKETSYYATDVESDSYRLDKGNHKISKVEIARGEVNDVAYSCTSDLTILATGTIVDKVKTDGSIMTDADGSIYFGSTSTTAGNRATLNNQKISLKKLIQEQGSEGYKTKVNYIINGSSNVELTTDIEIVNTNKEQNGIAGGNINITIKNENLLCTIQNKKAYMSALTLDNVIGKENRKKVEKIEFVNYIPENLESEEIVAHYDLSDTNKGTEANSVIGWLVSNGHKGNVYDALGNITEEGTIDLYDLYIGSTSKIYGTYMSDAFRETHNLKTITFDNLDTSEVTDMTRMFYYCSSLTTLDLNNFDTSNVTNMDMMFYNCKSLTGLDLNNFDTSKVTNMSSMFNGCSKLTTLGLSNFNTSQVTDMSWMFLNCKNLISLDLSNFNTSNVTTMSQMFQNCNCLTSLDLSNFDTSKVTQMDNMFSICTNLTNLNLSNFNTSQVTDMSRMFNGCFKLTTLDMRTSEFESVTSYSYMFNNVPKTSTMHVRTGQESFVTTAGFKGTIESH